MSEAKKVAVSVEQGTKETLEERVARLERALQTVEIETTAEALEKLESGDKKQPLIKGFQDKTVVLPVAMLQRQIKGLASSLEQGLQQAGQGNVQTLQYIMQSLGPLKRQLVQVDRTLEAVVNLSGHSDETIQAEIDKIVETEQAEQEAREDERLNRVVVERAAKEGDVVKIDYVGRVDGEIFDGGSAKNYHLTLGSGSFIPGFEEQVVGIEAGKTKEIKVTFPTDYGAKQLAGKEATFTVTAKAVKELQEVEETIQEG